MRTIWITWLNYLGGFEYFLFISKKEYSTDVEETGETEENILPNWPESWQPQADTVRKQTFRDTRESILIRSQWLTLDQVNALSMIRRSPLVQIIVDRGDRRTVLVDSDSWVKYDEKDKLYSISFKIRYTDKNASQRV